MKCRILLAVAACAIMVVWSNSGALAAKAKPSPSPKPKATPSPSPTPAGTGLADKVDSSAATDGVYKAVALSFGNFDNFPHVFVQATPALGGAPVKLVVPNDKNDPKQPDPDNAIHNVLKTAKPDELLEIKVGKIGNTPAIVSAKKYTPKPYEEQPNVVFFSTKTTAKVGQQDRPAVEVTKYLQTELVLVPQKTGADGKLAPDADIMAKIDTFKAGDTLDMQVEKVGGNNVIKSVEVFVPPTQMEFVKIARQTTADGKNLVGAELKDKSGASQTYMIDPAGKDASALTSKLGGLATGTQVLVKSKSDDRGNWLTLLEAAPKAKE